MSTPTTRPRKQTFREFAERARSEDRRNRSVVQRVQDGGECEHYVDDRWYGWELCPRKPAMICRVSYWYEIPLSQVSSAQELLDWVCQLKDKTWMRDNPNALVGMLDAFEDVFNFRIHFKGYEGLTLHEAEMHMNRFLAKWPEG